MRLNVTIDLDNAAFDDADEVRRLLNDAGETIIQGNRDRGNYTSIAGRLFDANGNPCGEWNIEED